MDDSIITSLREIILERKTTDSLDEYLSDRIHVENQVRKLKRQGKKCQFEKDHVCTKTDIRCGERQQYRLPEEDVDRDKPHCCNYKPQLPLSEFYVLAVDDDPAALELCEEYLISAGISLERIATAGSVQEAQDILKEGKVLNRQYCIVMSDIKMEDGTGFDLVNHLVERNYNSRILLMSGQYEENDVPKNYLGNLEVVPGQTVVSKFFAKPVHYSDFQASIKEVEKEFQPAVCG